MSIGQPISAVLCVSVLLVSGGFARPATGQGGAPAAAVTITAALGGLRELVQQIETSASAVIETGNVALGQQQMALAATLKAVIAQVESAYAASLDKTASTLTTQEMNVRDDLQMLFNRTSDTVTLSMLELQKRIEETHSSANQLLDKALPLASRAPVFYSVQTRDILQGVAPNPSDVVVRGYLLGDPELPNRKPVVRIEGEEIPGNLVTAEAGRVLIELPPSLREKIRLANRPCEPIRSFGLEVTVQYYRQGGWLSGLWRWVSWPSQATWTARVVPGGRVYELTVVADGTRLAEKHDPQTFSAKSGSVNFGCEESKSANASWNMPEGALNINVTSCKWEGVSNAKSHSASHTLTGLTATCAGNIRGLDYRRVSLLIGSVAECPGGGHGHIELAGQYSMRRFEQEDARHEVRSILVSAEVPFSLPTESGLNWKTARVELRRRGCEEIIDTATIPGGTDANERRQQMSEKGLFTIVWQRGSVRIVPSPQLQALE